MNKGSADSGDKQYVTMLQHAMFCKGYNPGSVSGNFLDQTADGLLRMKHDAGFDDTGDPQVNSMWMKAVLSSDAYNVVSQGDKTIREAQRYLNRNYYNYFGVEPCDGHYSRDTNQAVIYAWQAEEGLDTQTANGNFGPTTKAKCPTLPIDGRYSLATLRNFIRIMQFELYFNKVQGSTELSFDGRYLNETIECVKSFQNFMCLPKTDGYADVGTIMSLMVSTGDPDRGAKGCDCSTKLDAQKASALYNAGYRYVGRYLTNVSGGRDKKMDLSEYRAISNEGLRVFPIFQQGNEEKEHFSYEQGKIDCDLAIKAAENLFLPQDATIYFAVDYDFMDVEVSNQVIPYFQGVADTMNNGKYASKYKIGVYGSRNICSRVSDRGLAVNSFVSDMSTGYSGNYGYAMPSNWAYDQFNETTFSGFGLDKDAVSGRDNGVALDTRYSGYNRQAAREYAQIWNDDTNRAEYYYYQHGDCANFVSQCLVAGGIPMNDAWYSHKYGNQIEVEQDPENTTFDVGEPWRLANQEYQYFKAIECGYRNGDVIEITNREEISGVLAKCAAEGNPIQMGDLMYFAHKGKGEDGVHHATMISYADLSCIKYTAHTSPKFDEDVTNSDYIDKDDMFIIRMHESN
ncbi:MAG: DUF1906 domain-containing protein [Lachnospiraceae bacterium]|nr:DUF1906 domain-containing protein [Lachnospiraceae bacterium]